MTKVLFISRSLVGANYHGGCVYPDAVLRFLAANDCEIHYLWLTNAVSSDRPIMKAPPLSDYFTALRVPGAVEAGRWLLANEFAAWLRLPFFLARKILRKAGLHRSVATEGPRALATPDEVRFVREAVDEIEPDAIIVDFAETADVLTPNETSARPRPIKLVLTHNVVHQRVTAYRQRGMPLDFFPLTREQEARLLANADVVVAIQREEAAELRDMLPQTRVVVAPMPAIPRPLPVTRQIEGRCLFVGGATQHNIDGLRWFLEEVWPRVLREVPSASLEVCGTVGASFERRYPNCQFHGNVPDLAAFYEEAALALVPLRAGSGLKIKLVEAMTFNRAIVSTSIGVEGLSDLRDGEVMPVANDASGFASAVSSMLTNRARRAQVAAQQTTWIREHLSPEQALGELLQVVTPDRSVADLCPSAVAGT